jgi:hypothetical protein
MHFPTSTAVQCAPFSIRTRLHITVPTPALTAAAKGFRYSSRMARSGMLELSLLRCKEAWQRGNKADLWVTKACVAVHHEGTRHGFT